MLVRTYEIHNPAAPETITQLLDEADYIICAFSGGKDSIAQVLWLIEQGYKSKIQLHHNLVDGWDDYFFDWKVTKDYCEKFAQCMNLPMYYSYRIGGFRGEITRKNDRPKPMRFQYIAGGWGTSGGKTGKIRDMLQFPRVHKDLRYRWCSSTLKITCMNAFISAQPEFENKKLVICTGERGQESPGRKKYQQIQIHTTNCNTRFVQHIRPVLDWREETVWLIMRKWGIVPHAAYYLNFSRCSCRSCIFYDNDALKRLSIIDPDIIEEIADYEIEFDKTIDYDKTRARKGLHQLNVAERAELGTSPLLDQDWIAIANSETWDIPIKVHPKEWMLPPGAFKKKQKNGAP